MKNEKREIVAFVLGGFAEFILAVAIITLVIGVIMYIGKL